MDSKEKQKIMVLFGIFGFAALMLYFNLLLKPQFSKFVAMNRSFQNVKAQVRGAEALIANEPRIKNQYNSLIGQSEALEKRLPRQGEISGLLQDFSSIAESSNVKILSVRPLEIKGNALQNEASGGYYPEFPILIEARAGYHQCGIFVNKLEGMERFIRIDDVDIKGMPDNPRQHHIKLRVSTYIKQ